MTEQHQNEADDTRQAVMRVVITTGISSVVTQLLIIREFLAQFQGNEFVIALVLFNWLILGGIGTSLAHRVCKHWRPHRAGLAVLSLVLLGVSPAQFLIIRGLRDIFFIHGTSVGFYATFFYTFMTSAPYCLLVGFVLPYSLFVIRAHNQKFSGTTIYIFDNLGDVSGGALFSFFLVYFFTPLQAVSLAALPLLVCAYLLFPTNRRRQLSVILTTAVSFLLLIICLLLESSSLKSATGKLVHYQETRYGRIEVYQDQEQFTLFSDASPLYSTENTVLAEESIHYPLAQLNAVQTILLISGEGGMLTELAKYNPTAVDYVEIDPALTSVQFNYNFLDRLEGLNVINQDGRSFLAASRQQYDAIIVNLPEPETFQINRFYTDRFFALAKEHLRPGGIFSFTMEGFDNYLAEPQRQKISSLYNTAAAHFKHIMLLPGQKIFFLCADVPIDPDIPGRLVDRDITTEYISAYFYGDVTPQRINHLNNLIDYRTDTNHDLRPHLMRLMFNQWFAKFSTSLAGFYSALLILLILYLLRATREEFVLFSTGAITMGAEILVIFAFQIFFGYIYLQIGLIVTVFLAGLLPGAWLGEKFRHQGKKLLFITDAALIGLLGIFIIILWSVQLVPMSFFLFFGFAVSLACGFQFPVALHLRGSDNAAAGRTFSADLLGAAFGTLFTSVVFIPTWGILWTAMILILLKLISMTTIITGHEKN